ncbi:nucleotidyltransferase family protein [Catenulispora pinistramenti]|uniref:nucleotidyltransferase family protein n=1 Tax=Catenulispora pinistramenti TaxID=2705254 RepID=UPI001BA824A2|nr:nucleotidyltransferase family protein [Catenulispora pinistramenti]
MDEVRAGMRIGMRIGAVILAAGGGRRLGGRPKALLSHGGELLVERAVRTARAGGCGEVVVVLGAEAAEVRRRADLTGCVVAVNQDWETGMGSSLRAGLAALPASCDAAVILLVDQPFVTSEAVRAVVAAGAEVAAATYAGRRGHPVLIAARHWPEASAAAVGDRGARDFLARHQVVSVPCDGSPADIDVPEDLMLLD